MLSRDRDPASDSVKSRLHDLILRKAAVRVSFHGISSSLVQVLDEAQVEGSAAVLITLELGDGSLSGFGRVKTDHAGASRATARLILNLGLLNLADSGEELNQVVIAGRPGQLPCVREWIVE